jgi:hypothetical protein
VTTAGHNIILGGGGGATEARTQASAHGLPGYGYSTTKVGHWLFVFGGSRERATTASNHLNLLNLGTTPCAVRGSCDGLSVECGVWGPQRRCHGTRPGAWERRPSPERDTPRR